MNNPEKIKKKKKKKLLENKTLIYIKNYCFIK